MKPYPLLNPVASKTTEQYIIKKARKVYISTFGYVLLTWILAFSIALTCDIVDECLSNSDTIYIFAANKLI